MTSSFTHEKLTTNLQISPTLAINQLSKRKIDQGEKVYKFGFGQSPFPVPAPIVKALKANAHKKEYLPTPGLPELRKNIVLHYNNSFGRNYRTSDVIIGPGSKELIFQTQLALKTNLILPAPSWVTYHPQAKLLGLKTTWIKSSQKNNWCITPEELDKHCIDCLLYTSPSPRDKRQSRMPSSA